MTETKLAGLWAYREEIDSALVEFFEVVPSLFAVELSAHSNQAIQYLSEYTLRPAKRIRGSLAALSYDTAAGTQHTSQAIQLGVVVELLQSYLLIIDDVMDNSSLRRGKPTVHELYVSEAIDNRGRHEAEMLAINVGCLAQHLANLQLARIDVGAEQTVQAFALLHTNIGVTGFGQLDDLYQQPGRPISEAEVLEKYRQKSSYYTFVNPLQAGFALAGKADKELIKRSVAFGVPAGIAFQIHDDYLGIWGDTSKLGKANLDDIHEGKFTLFMQYALAHSDEVAKKKLRSILGNPKASARDLQVVQEILVESGSKEYCRERVVQSADAAKQALRTMPPSMQALTSTLLELVDYTIMREY